MYKQALVALTFGVVFALSSASCGPTCPAGQQSCGNANPSPAAGSTGDDAGATCGLLTKFKRCMTAYCATASNPFCMCYKRGYDIAIIPTGCKCVDFDPQQFCDDANNSDGSSYDCAADSSRISTYCVPVN